VSVEMMDVAALNESVVVDRLDQTLGKPSIWMLSSEREKQRMTIVSRLSRVELQVSCTVDHCLLRHILAHVIILSVKTG